MRKGGAEQWSSHRTYEVSVSGKDVHVLENGALSLVDVSLQFSFHSWKH